MGLGTVRRTALVTGAAGFLGSHLVDQLLADGFEVVGIDNLMTGDLTNLENAGRDPHFHFEIGDVREPLQVYAELVFNFACPASPIHYQQDPYATLTTSVLGAQRLVEMARGRRCTIVHASTSEVYGDPLVHPQPESYWGSVNPIGERACYDEGKRCAETLLNDARRRWRVDARILRLFNTYGPRMAIDDGRVVSNFIVQALRKLPLTIFGDGSQSRSFCYVDDLVGGILRAAVCEELVGPINLGNPGEFTISELAEIVIELTGAESRLIYKNLPQDDPRQRKPDISRARELLDFAPRVDMRAGLELTIANFDERLRALGSAKGQQTAAPSAALRLTPSRSLQTLAERLPVFVRQVAACGDAHRIGDRMSASERFIDVLDAIHAVIAEVGRAAAEHAQDEVGRALFETEGQLVKIIEQLSAAQLQHDTVQIADLREYEAIPLLQRCHQVALND